MEDGMRSAVGRASDAAIDSAIAAFVRGPVTLVLAARNAKNLATAAYCRGCRVDGERGTISVFVDRSQSLDVLDNVRAFPTVALVVCRPTTLRTLQLKGNDARVEPLADADLARVAAYIEMIVAELAQVGDAPDWSRAAFAYRPDELVAVTFTATRMYVQTPGPEAGEPVGARPTL